MAEEVGRRIAQSGARLICGGLGGVMEAACKGAAEAGGTTIGILPGGDPGSANPYVEVAIATGLDIARNLIIVRTSDALIAINGSYGTLNEIAAALNLDKPVVALETWDLPTAGDVDPALFFPVRTPEEAVQKALALAAHK
ncbi:hypothetical protein AMJ85_01620 [candidate division BRC1 bacterium SM23_51]|nr:MAG: hypothetical protein AMJ85_01620 [candidate division BRC1 bacterium SM23_51]